MLGRLLSRESLSKGLNELLIDAEHWIIQVQRSQFDWDSGSQQEPALTFRKGDDLELSPNLDPRLIKSKRVKLLAFWSDGGAISINFTDGRIDVILESPSTDERVANFNETVSVGAASRFLSAGWALILFLWPFLIGMMGYAAGTAFDSNFRTWALDQGRKDKAPPSEVADTIVQIGFYTWPIGLALALMIGYVRLMSGGLKVKRTLFTTTSVLQFIYRLRKETFRRDGLRQIWVASAAGIIVALATVWFVK
ncbi:hypothetical protein ACIQMJ_36080 [Actinosynnema sp. NPDC091369]